MLNYGRYHFKKSKIEKNINIMFACNILMMFSLNAILSTNSYFFLKEQGWKHWYLFPEGSELNVSKFARPVIGSYYLALNEYLPLSLVVALEIVKIIWVIFLELDYEMSYPDYFI